MYFLFITPALTFIAFLLLLLVSLSVPIIKSIYLFSLTTNVSSSLFNSAAYGAVKFGVWGYCISSVDISRVDQFTDLITKTTTAALVLHPIACGFTFLTLVISFFMLRRGSNGTARLPSIITLGIGILATLLTTIVFLIDVILVAVIRNRVNDRTDGRIVLNWGNAVWMALGATIALWLAMVGACGGVCARGRRFHTRKTEQY
uniref:Pali-domain-containing protein n=1 Tax=Moniliophthora roreri TaxID=221103 RepID=A0A0W0FUD6_MONRR